MKYKNYKWLFAISITLVILVPIFVFIDAASLILIVILEEKINIALIIHLVLLACLIISFFVLAIVGSILYKKSSLTQDSEYFYQNKTKLKKDNLKKLCINRIYKIYCITFLPIKQGAFKSCTLIYYFASQEEMQNFIETNYLRGYLQEKSKAFLMVEKSFDNPNINRFSCPCCGNFTFTEKPGTSTNICPVCLWMDDQFSIASPNEVFDTNKVSLNDAKNNYQSFRACKEEYQDKVRRPLKEEINNPHNKKMFAWNYMWKLYAEEKLEYDYFVLCQYYSGVNGEGHHGFLDNNDSDLEQYSEVLKKVLPQDVYRSFEMAYLAYLDNKDVSELCEMADADFNTLYERKIEEILQKYAEILLTL